MPDPTNNSTTALERMAVNCVILTLDQMARTLILMADLLPHTEFVAVAALKDQMTETRHLLHEQLTTYERRALAEADEATDQQEDPLVLYPCQYCPQSFLTLALLQEHVHLSHIPVVLHPKGR